jgi:hypothetical protein
MGALVVGESIATAATTVTRTSGTGTVSGLTITSNTLGQTVKFTGTATGSITVVVEVDSPTEIEAIEVEVNKSGSAIGQVQLICRAKAGSSGKLQRVGNVKQVSNDGVTDGELIIENITTDAGGTGGGNIGARGTTRGGKISAPVIATINCAGNITASLVASGRPDGSQSNVNFVNVLNSTGAIYGDIIASQGVIGNVVAAGNIGGSPAVVLTQPTLKARDGVRKVSCATFYGVIDTTQYGSPTNVQRIVTTGDFVGALFAQHLAVIDTSLSEKGIVIGGDMAGTMTFNGSLISTLTINGALSGQITASVASDRPASDPTRDTDVTIGTFPASGRFIAPTNIAGPVTIGGPLAGTMTIGTIGGPYGLYANISATSLTGLLTIHGAVQPGKEIILTGALMPGGRIHIGTSLLGNVRLPAGGLLGELYVNGDAPAVPGTWSGAVYVGATALSAPPNGEYTQAPSTRGGGTLAYGPFRLHKSACTPPHDSPTPVLATQFSPLVWPSLTIRSYGPMMLAPGLANWIDALKIEREDPAGSCNWVDAKDAFDATMIDAVDSRELALFTSGDGFPVPGKYRVAPTGLLCAAVMNNPPVVWPSSCGGGAANGAYLFTIALDCDDNGQPDAAPPPGTFGSSNTIPDVNNNGIPDSCESVSPACPCDGDGNHSVTPDDLFLFLDRWFSISPQADFDSSGAVSTDDLFAFLDAWFATQGPCP